MTAKESAEEALDAVSLAVARGEVLLVLGQDHSPLMIDQVLKDAKTLVASNRSWTSLAEMFTPIGSDSSRRATLAALFAGREPDVALLELASLPWMSVITSAVDPLISKAFLNVGSQRRLVELGPTQLSGISIGRATQVLRSSCALLAQRTLTTKRWRCRHLQPNSQRLACCESLPFVRRYSSR